LLRLRRHVIAGEIIATNAWQRDMVVAHTGIGTAGWVCVDRVFAYVFARMARRSNRANISGAPIKIIAPGASIILTGPAPGKARLAAYTMDARLGGTR
jgi:hypothetical protein